MIFADPLAGVTNTIRTNFGLTMRIRPSELTILSFGSGVPLSTSPTLAKKRRRRHGMHSSQSMPLASSELFLLTHPLRILDQSPCQLMMKFNKCHHFLSTTHKVPHSEVCIHLGHRQEKCKDTTSPSDVLSMSHPKKTADDANYYDHPMCYKKPFLQKGWETL